MTCDDISVNDGRMTISNASTQALTGLSSAAVIKGAPSCLEFKMLLSQYGYSYMNRDKYFPSGFFFTLSSTTVRRFVTEADSFTVELQKFPETVFAVYDNEGSPHIADLRFTNASHTAGYIPLVVLKGYINEENYYLYVSKTEDGWKIDGLSGAIGGSYKVARIRNIPAKKLSSDFILKVYKDYQVKYCPLTYCYNVLNSNSQ